MAGEKRKPRGRAPGRGQVIPGIGIRERDAARGGTEYVSAQPGGMGETPEDKPAVIGTEVNPLVLVESAADIRVIFGDRKAG